MGRRAKKKKGKSKEEESRIKWLKRMFPDERVEHYHKKYGNNIGQIRDALWLEQRHPEGAEKMIKAFNGNAENALYASRIKEEFPEKAEELIRKNRYFLKRKYERLKKSKEKEEK